MFEVHSHFKIAQTSWRVTMLPEGHWWETIVEMIVELWDISNGKKAVLASMILDRNSSHMFEMATEKMSLNYIFI